MINKINLEECDKVEMWKKRFFEAQAGMEKFLVSKYGYKELDEYIKFNAEVFRNMQEDKDGAEDLILRLAQQAECYKSEYSIDCADKNKGELTIFNCGIWDYRKKASNQGVELTFDSPCTRYCTKLTSELIKSKGYDVSYELLEIGCHCGCRWIIEKNNNKKEGI